MNNEDKSKVTKVLKRQPVLMERFSIVRMLGEGASGAVYHVIDKVTDREVALKLLVNAAAFDEHTLARFHEEFQALSRVRHSNVTEAYDFFGFDEEIAFSMEFVDGIDLNKLRKREDLSAERVVDIVSQILIGLDALHRANIVHRDLKLENVLLGKNGAVKISDLGLMRRTDQEGLTRTGVILGTPQYMPPEYIKNSIYDNRGDVYAAGVILSELLTGERRLGKLDGMEAIQHLLKTKFKLPNLKDNPKISSHLASVIAKSMEVKPKKRFQSALEMKDALLRQGKYAVALSPELPTGNIRMGDLIPKIKSGRNGKSGRWVGATLALLVALAGVFIGRNMGFSGDEQIVSIAVPDGTYRGKAEIFGDTGKFKDITLSVRGSSRSVKSELAECYTSVGGELVDGVICDTDRYLVSVTEQRQKGFKGSILDKLQNTTHTFEVGSS